MKANYLLRQLAWMTPEELRTARYVARHANRCLAHAATPTSPLSACAVLALAGGVVLHQRAQARLAHGLAQDAPDLAARCDAHAATQTALLHAQAHLDAHLRGNTPAVALALPEPTATLPAMPTPDLAADPNTEATATAIAEPRTTPAPPQPTPQPAPQATTPPAAKAPQPAPKAHTAPADDVATRQAEAVAYYQRVRNILLQPRPAPARPATPSSIPTALPASPRGSLSGLPLPSERAREVEVLT